MTLELRPETPEDYDAIDAVECSAFREMDEASIVRLVRERYPAYDPEFSVVAWENGRAVGHTLFTPARIRLMGETVSALAVGPVAVAPVRQRTGVGAAMLDYGHHLGRERGFKLAFLHGHPSYYPRVGYIACHGFASVGVDTNGLSEPGVELQAMPVTADDLDWLASLHVRELADVDFAWPRTADIREWTLHGMNTVVWWTPSGQRVGYSEMRPRSDKVNLMLAETLEAALSIIRTVKPKTLAHHPSGWLVRNAVDPVWGTATVRKSDAAMAFELEPGVLDEYKAAVESDSRPTGHVNFPMAFDLFG